MRPLQALSDRRLIDLFAEYIALASALEEDWRDDDTYFCFVYELRSRMESSK